MAIWLIANNLWSSSETPVDLGIVDGVQKYRVQSLMGAYNNCVSGDTLTLDPDSPNFKDNRGYRLKTVIFEMNTNWTVNKSITLSGGEYRLRIDGGGNYYFKINSASHIIDCDIVNSSPVNIIGSKLFIATRCRFVNMTSTVQSCFIDANTFNDCLFVNVKSSFYDMQLFANRSTCNRCLFYGAKNAYTTSTSSSDIFSFFGTTLNDCVYLSNDTGSKPSEHCVAPPPDDPSDVTDWSKWEEWDFHLKPDSSYATGNSLTSADGEVLDLDGVPRKPGGAKGAYEVAKSVIYFNTTGWDGTGALSWLGVTKTQWGEYPTYLCGTVDQAVNAAPYDGIVTPDPDSASFRDAAGFPLHTVTVTMGSSLTVNKSITLAGGAYRLRLDGGGAFGLVDNAPAFDVSDVDFVNFGNGLFTSVFNMRNTVFTAHRCLFANFKSGSQVICEVGNGTEQNDCCYTFFQTSIENVTPIPFNTGTYNRCTFVFARSVNQTINTYNDCVRWVNETTDLSGFVNPPSSWDDTDKWENFDYRLLPTSPNATGNALTSADESVYDLAGNKRKVGGALGAFEVLSDVTHWSREFIKGWKYTVEYESDDAPRLVSCGKTKRKTLNPISTTFYFELRSVTSFQYYLSSSATWTDATISSLTYVSSVYGDQVKIFRATNDSGAYTYITLYAPNDTAPSNAKDCNLNIYTALSYVKQDDSSANSVTVNSILYIDDNTLYADTASTVKKIYIAGKTHVRLGDVTAEVVLGLGATVKTSGNLTLVGETLTSDELFEKVKLVAPAEFTLKDCTVSD